MSVVPLIQSFQRGNALEDLFGRSVRLATVVQAASRRRDVRELRARLCLLLLKLRCPLRGIPGRSWYIPGAVVRLGISGIARAWRGFFGEAPPAERTLRAHLGTLEKACAIIRAPGDWIPTAPGAPRLRHADTFHVIEDERDATWWARDGLAVLDQHPEARTNASTWRRLFRAWRERARDPQALFSFPSASTRPDQASPVTATREDGKKLRDALESKAPLAVLQALRSIGAAPDGRVLFQIAEDDSALRKAAARMAGELERRTRIRNRPGWFVWAFREAGGRIRRAAPSAERFTA
jgi:hypothetical protein